MKSRALKFGLALAAAGLCVQPVTATAAQGDWLFRGGVGIVDPKSDNLIIPGETADSVIDVDTGTSLTVEGTYMLADNWGIELLAAYPFTHDVKLDGTKAAEVDHLPPTLSVQYHFIPDGKIRPYVGLGLNYTMFMSEKTKGPLAGADLKIADSWGMAAQVGADIGITDRWFANVGIRYIDIEGKAKLDGASIGTVVIDPMTYQVQVGYRVGGAAGGN